MVLAGQNDVFPEGGDCLQNEIHPVWYWCVRLGVLMQILYYYVVQTL